jgi:hypothetical protein
LLSLELVLIYNPHINKGAIAVIDRPLQAIFWAAEKSFFFQNESVLKGGLNWVFLGPFWRRNSKNHKFSVIKKFTAGNPSD